MVRYSHLDPDGKYISYADRNPIVGDGVWSSGERLLLNGYDGDNTSDRLSVFVSIKGLSNTSNHYGFREGTSVNVRILDTSTHRIISEGDVIVQHTK